MTREPLPPPLQAPSWLREVPLAHRGLHDGDRPENSLPAFEAAADAGYGVELDVMLSRDEIPVVAHDASLRRVAGVGVRVGQLTVEQLAGIRLDGSDAHVPTLAEALDLLGEVPVMVELKQGLPRGGKLEGRTAAVLERHRGPFCIASFNPSTVRWYRRNLSAVTRVLTAGPLREVPIPQALRNRLAQLRDLDSVAPHAVSYDLDGLPAEATDRWRDRGGTLVTWTAVGPEGLRRARALADNVIFEHVRP